MKQGIKRFVRKQLYRIPNSLKINQVDFTSEQLNELELSINKNCNRPEPGDKELDAALKNEMNVHLISRLEDDRMHIIPWLSAVKPIKHSKILEIGCGTGTSTLALAEQGAIVTAIDIDNGALTVAKDRLRIARQNADFHFASATEVKGLFKHLDFDFIIFFASIEHMTIEERIMSLRDVWSMLKPSSYLVIIESPNRLWYNDLHTSLLPFFHWLPDELAFMYSKYSSRIIFKDSYRDLDEKNMLHFLRMGRGISFHEFEIAITSISDLNIVSSLDEYEKLDFIKYSRKQLKYISFLRSLKKGVQKGFCYPYLNIIIKKD